MREEEEKIRKEEEARLKAVEDARFTEETAQLDSILVRQQEILSSWRRKRQEEVEVQILSFKINHASLHM